MLLLEPTDQSQIRNSAQSRGSSLVRSGLQFPSGLDRGSACEHVLEEVDRIPNRQDSIVIDIVGVTTAAGGREPETRYRRRTPSRRLTLPF